MNKILDEKLINWTNAVNLQQLPLNEIWLEQQIRRERISPKWINFLRFAKEKLEFIYPDRWDIQLSLVKDTGNEYITNYIGNRYFVVNEQRHFCFEIIIKFPEIIITNSANQSHTIKDLYVNFPFIYCEDINNFVITGMFGRRGTLSMNEYLTGYGHSHLNFNIKEYRMFCLGNTEINNHINDMVQDLDRIKFESLLFQLDQYVRWESLEGVPYTRIESITNNQQIDILTSTTVKNYLNKLKTYRIENREYELEWKINNQRIELIDNEILEEYLKIAKDLDGFIIERYGGVVVSKRANGEYVAYRNGTVSNTAQGTRILFKGQWNKVNVSNFETNSLKIYVHPEIKKLFKKTIENEANDAIINLNRKRRIDSFGYPKKTT